MVNFIAQSVKRTLQRAKRALNGTHSGEHDPDEFLRNCRAVIHVGANEGHERALYDSYSLSVLWVEALPDAYEKLTNNLRDYPKQKAANALVTDKEGEFFDFHVSSNSGESSSIYEFSDHSKLWPDVTFNGTIRLRSTTLATLLHDQGLAPSAFDALILDVQGAELLVVLGSGDLLESIRYVKAEAADFESYKGACTLATLSQALEERGFVFKRKERFAGAKGVGSYYNALYERSGAANKI